MLRIPGARLNRVMRAKADAEWNSAKPIGLKCSASSAFQCGVAFLKKSARASADLTE